MLLKEGLDKFDKNTMTNKELHQLNDIIIRIGGNVASGWGASCYDYELDRANNKIVYYCVEGTEKFITELAFNELGKYDY